jgi:hypothetical protein
MERSRDIYERIIAQGRQAIQDFIIQRKAEELFLDFKRSSNDGNDAKLSDIDRKNLAKAISGFGNSEGGVIVWGVDCSKAEDGADVAKSEVVLSNPSRFASLLQGVISGCTIPPHSKVENHIIQIEPDKGFVVTHIPKSNYAPHQMLPNKQYYIRAGSDFVPTPHDVLSGMFGRRPQSHVFHQYILGVPELDGISLKIDLGVTVHNEGPGIATDIFVVCTMERLPGENSALRFEIPDKQNWTGCFELSRRISLISSVGFRLPPGATAQPLVIHLWLKPPFKRKLRITGHVGSSDSRRYEFVIDKTSEMIEEKYNIYMKKVAAGYFTEDERQEIAEAIIGETKA